MVRRLFDLADRPCSVIGPPRLGATIPIVAAGRQEHLQGASMRCAIWRIAMRELTREEAAHVNGGLGPALGLLIRSVVVIVKAVAKGSKKK